MGHKIENGVDLPPGRSKYDWSRVFTAINKLRVDETSAVKIAFDGEHAQSELKSCASAIRHLNKNMNGSSNWQYQIVTRTVESALYITKVTKKGG